MQPTILVVDDEPLIRSFVVRCLVGAGYHVLQAASAERAWELLEAASTTPIALLLSDVRMPGLSGPELVARVQERHRTLPTLLMSGTSRRLLVREGELPPDVDLLQKPFRVGELLARVEQLLAASVGLGDDPNPA